MLCPTRTLQRSEQKQGDACMHAPAFMQPKSSGHQPSNLAMPCAGTSTSTPMGGPSPGVWRTRLPAPPHSCSLQPPLAARCSSSPAQAPPEPAGLGARAMGLAGHASVCQKQESGRVACSTPGGGWWPLSLAASFEGCVPATMLQPPMQHCRWLLPVTGPDSEWQARWGRAWDLQPSC